MIAVSAGTVLIDRLTADGTVLTLKVDCEVFSDREISREVRIDSEVSEKKLTD